MLRLVVMMMMMTMIKVTIYDGHGSGGGDTLDIIGEGSDDDDGYASDIRY